MIAYRICALTLLSLAVWCVPVSDDTCHADDANVAEVTYGDEMDASHGDVHAHQAGDTSDEAPHAEDHGSSSFLLTVDPGAAFWNLAIFLVVFFILAKFVWPPILAGIQARESKIHDDLADAQNAKLEAESMLSSYQSKLDEAQVRVQEMIAEARKDAESTKQEILDTAKEEANRQRDRAVAEIESAKTAALGEVANQSSALALQLARQVVGREINDSDHAELIRQSLDNLPSNN